MLRKIFGKRIIFIFSILFLIFTVTSVFIIAIKNNPTEPISKVTIESDNYNNPGSYHIEKSAKWIDNDKAEITFDVNTIPIGDGRYKDVIFVIDMSGSMVGDRLETAKKNSKELVDVLLDDDNNSVALITFDTSSEVLSGFTKDKSKIINEINDLSYRGATNYNAALNNVLEVLDGYEPKDNTDLVVLFLTDGHPNEDNPNQIGTYHIIKNMYPYLTIHGVQYELGNTIISDIEKISDEQWIANINSLHNVLFDAILSPVLYDEYEIVDYIDKEYFYINSISDINVSVGNVRIEEDNGFQKLIWNLGENFRTGNNASMKINVQLKDEYESIEGLYPTNDHEIIKSKIQNKDRITKESDKTPVLKNYYKVIYDTNTPEGCTIENIESENHFIFTNVTKKQDQLSCDGYLFKGWKIADNDVERVNDDVFMMPTHDVTIKAIWSKVDISKSMDGSIYEQTTLYKAVENEALNGTEAILYDGETEDGGGDENVYYYTGNVTKNNVIFGDFCWQIVRTTDTGGVKLIYNGKPDSAGNCGNDRGTDNNEGLGRTKSINLTDEYIYGTEYTYDKQSKLFTLEGEITPLTWNQNTYENIIGKYTCRNSLTSCSELYYIESFKSETNANAVPYINNLAYQNIGITYFNGYSSPAFVGYMYNKVYNHTTKKLGALYRMLDGGALLNTEFYYSDSYTIDGNNYKLDQPTRIGTEENYQSLVGKYTFRDSSDEDYTNSYLYYIVGVYKNAMYYLQLSNGDRLEDIDTYYYFGDELIDNQDGTYTISGNINRIKRSQWIDEYITYGVVLKLGLYTCNSDSLTCENPYYIFSRESVYNYNYISVSNIFKYGSYFKYNYDTNEYELQDTIDFYDFKYDNTPLYTHHYTCFNKSGKCKDVAYVYYVEGTNNYYITLSNNTSIQDALREMLWDDNVNEKNSSVKNLIDLWYKLYMNKYTSYLEDIVYCGDRSIYSYAGWDPNNGDVNNSSLVFKEGKIFNDLTCTNKIDKYTVSNEIGNKALIYPVGMLTKAEYKKLWSFDSRDFWLNSPGSFHYQNALVNFAGGNSNANSIYKVRPVISLKPNTEYTSGDGSYDKPFYIPTE